MREIMESVPLWGVLPITIALVLGISELGFMLGRKRAQQPGFETEAQVSSLTGAHLGLLAFILAFSFSMAGVHADKRKGLILEEANAIEVIYLRASLLGSSQGEQIQQIVRDYTHLRSTADNITDIPAFIRQSEKILIRLWEELRVLSASDDFDELDSLLVESGGELVVIHEKRVAAALRTRIPMILWVSLYALLALSMLGMGYFSGIKQQRSPLANTALAVSFSMVVFLIADLDRPREGMVKPDQSLMKELSRRMEDSKSR